MKLAFLKTLMKKRRWYVRVAFIIFTLGILGTLLFLSLSHPSDARAGWWNDTFKNRQKLPISNASGEVKTDFQMRFELDTSTQIAAGKMRSDCGDMRFTNVSGNELSYWLEPNTCNTTTTVVFVKIPEIPQSGADIYWYYGNSNAYSKSDTTDVFIKELSPAIVTWPLDETAATQSYARVISPGDEQGRDIVINGGFDTDTIWTKGAGSTISSGVANLDTLINQTMVSQALPLTTGKTYSVTYTVSNYSQGSFNVFAGSTTTQAIGQIVASNGTFTDIVISNGPTIGFQSRGLGFTGSIDNVSVKQINVPASGSTPANLLADGDMEASGTTSWTAATSTLSKQTGSPFAGSQVLRITYNGVSTAIAYQAITTAGYAYRVTGYARSDGTGVPRVRDSSGTSLFTGTNSTTWQPIDFVFVTSASTAPNIQLAGSSLGSGNYVEFDSVTVALDNSIRRDELLQDGSMEASGTSYWQTNFASSANITKQTTSPQSGSQVLRVAPLAGGGGTYQSGLSIGRTYRITGYVRGDGTNFGTVRSQATAGVTLFQGTSSPSWQYFDVTFVATANNFGLQSGNLSNGSNYAEFDSISVTEVSPLVGLNTNGVTVGATANGHLSKAYSFDGTNDNVNIYSSDLNSVFNPNEGTLVAWAKVSGSGIWSDGTQRNIIEIQSDGNNQIQFARTTTNNQLTVSYSAGGVHKSNNFSISPTEWFQVVITWSRSGDQVKTYFNGAQSGSTLTGLGTWTGNLLYTSNAIGALTSSGSRPWSGLINDVRLYDRALSAEEIAAQYSSTTDIQTYSTDNYSQSELIRQFDPDVTLGSPATAEVGPGPIAHWSFDSLEGSTVQDVSGNGNNGTNSGATQLTEDQCISGKCMRFDGVDDVVTAASNSTLDLNNRMSIGAWVKAKNTGTDQTIVSRYNGQVATGLIFYVNSSGKATYHNGSSFFFASNRTITDGNWHYVEYVQSSTTDHKIYIDGILDNSSTTVSSTPDPSNALRIGSYLSNSVGTAYFNGALDQVKIYPYARTAEEVMQDYMAGAANAGSSVVLGTGDQSFLSNGLAGYWKMDEASWSNNCSTTSVTDSSGNGVNGASCPNLTGSVGGAVGKFGNAGSFDGVDDYISANVTTTDVTFSTWVKFNATSCTAGQPCNITGAGLGTSILGYYGVYGNTIAVYDGVNWRQGTTTLTTGQWYYFTISFNAATKDLRLYVNGALEYQGNSSTYSNSSLTRIGGNTSHSTRYLNGYLDESRIYNRVLSPAEVRSLYQYAPGPVGYWKFDEGSGTNAYDNSGNGNTGTLQNDANWMDGKVGSSVLLDGTNDYVSVPDPTTGSLSESTGTVSLWMRKDTLSEKVLLMNRATYDGTTGIELYTRGTDQLCFRGSGTTQLCALSVYLPNTWTHVTVSYSGTSAQLYVDGVLRSQGTIEQVAPSTNNFYIGAYGTMGYHFDGKIDEVRIYNYARTADQIREDMLAGHPVDSASVATPKTANQPLDIATGSEKATVIDGAGADPVAYWKLDERTGTTAADSSGNGNTGTLTNGPEWVSGKFGSALRFDGSNDYIQVSTPANLNITGFTAQGWIYTISQPQYYSSMVMSLGAGFVLYRSQGASGGIETQISNGTNWITPSLGCSTNEPMNVWHFYALTFDPTNNLATLYLDGRKCGSGTVTGGLNPAYSGLRLGQYAGSYHDGMLDELKIYNYARTAAQIAYDYNRGKPVAHWKMDECQGTTIHDASGNGNHGTLSIGAAGSITSVGTCDTASTSWGTGKIGRQNASIGLGGTDDSASIPDSTSLSLSNSTWSAFGWVNISASLGSTVKILNKGSTNYALGIKSQAVDCLQNGVEINTGSTITANTWHFVGCTYDGTTLRSYLNGLEQGSVSASTVADSNTPLSLGENGSSSQYVNGKIDEVSVYNYALSNTQVKALFNNGSVNFR